MQENHYCPFGLNQTGDWYATISPENKYQYNGKELNTDLNLDWIDYGARYYDPAIGRWGQIDPLADKFANWSAFSYTYNNPIRFVDPDGMAADDIILKGTTKQKQRLLSNLQALTNDRLDYVPETGEVFVTKRNAVNSSKDLDAGTALVNDLISSKKEVTIELSALNGTDPVDESGEVSSKKAKADSENGTGTDSRVLFDPTSKGNSITNEDGTKGRPGVVGLAHELLHARNNAEGDNKRGVATNKIDPDDPEGKRTLSQEEVNVRRDENVIRDQMGIKKRSN
ncbi:MAG: M91 family zinc metallopeptidase [Saprospiraceae bacterium]|nr:M91 family zinc metallopeptidase [Saprospiraceae bacterium]